jgi:hypothetical protein
MILRLLRCNDAIAINKLQDLLLLRRTQPASQSEMRARALSFIGLLIIGLTCLPTFATSGIFQGRVVAGTQHEAGKYIYVEAQRGYLRRVNIQKCRIVFDRGIAASQHLRNPAEALRDGAEVRVIAEQREQGDWVASEIVVLKLAVIDQVQLRT